MVAYVVTRKRSKPEMIRPDVKPAELPNLVSAILDEPWRGIYGSCVTNLDMLRHLLRFGLEIVKACGYVR
jgi:hypothetical protein